MTLIVRTVTRWVVGFIFLYGIYTVFSGHLTAGGGFVGGLILGCSYILLLIAYGRGVAYRNMDWRIARVLSWVGGMMVLGLSLLGLIFGKGEQALFFSNIIQKVLPGKPFHLLNGGIIPLGNLGVAIMVLGGVFVCFSLLSSVRLFDDFGREIFKSMEDKK